jgi:predicted GNAT family acetyltransferase
VTHTTLEDVRQSWRDKGIKHAMHEKGGVIRVGQVVVPAQQRGKGVGTAAMQELHDYADRSRQRVALTPSTDFGATSKSRLNRFYGGLGYKPNRADFAVSERMIREPTPRPDEKADGGSVAASKPSFAEINALAAEHGANSPHFMRAYEAYQQEPDEKLQKAAGGAVDHHPTDAQKAAGNYAKERTSFQGLPISIENKAGSTRSGVDGRGKKWAARVPCDYGYIRGTTGADGDHVDCYLGPDANSNIVVVVSQHDHRSGRFDEHKCLLGFQSERAALKCYVDGFSDGKGPDRIGSVETMSVDAFKHWLKHGKTTAKANGPKIVDRALGLVRGAG